MSGWESPARGLAEGLERGVNMGLTFHGINDAKKKRKKQESVDKEILDIVAKYKQEEKAGPTTELEPNAPALPQTGLAAYQKNDPLFSAPKVTSTLPEQSQGLAGMAARTQAMSALPAVSPRNVTALDTSGLKPAIPPRHTGVSSLGLTEKPQASTFDKYKKGIKMRGEILQVFEKHNMRDEYDKGVNSLLTRWQVLAQHDPEGAEKTWNDSILGEELGPLKNVQGGKNRLVSFDLAKDVYQIDQRGKVTRIQEGRQAKKAPKTRTIYQGATAVNQEWDENAGSWSKVGEGQRFTKTGDGSGGAKQYSVGVEETKSVKAYLDEKYQQDANVAARIAADKNKFEQDDNNEGREFKITDITKYLSPEQRTTRIKIIEDVNKALATDKTLDYMTAVERRLQKSAESQSRKRPGMAQQARKQKLSPQQALELLRQRGRIK